MRAFVGAVAAVVAMGIGIPPAQAADPRSLQVASNRVDNLRLHRIDSGPLAGRLVVAGRLDHVHSTDEQDVRVRMTLRSGPGRDGASVIGRTSWDYELPAGAGPQNSPLRWLLTPKQSAAVEDLASDAVVVVDIWQNDVDGEHVTRGHRHSAKATRLAIHATGSKLRVQPRNSRLPMLLSGIIYTGSGLSVYTSEDDEMNVYVDMIDGPGWKLQPSWATAVPVISSSGGPGSGYIGSDGGWSLQSTLGAAGCTASTSGEMAATGTFIDQGGELNISWSDLTCPFGLPSVAAGSASGLEWQT